MGICETCHWKADNKEFTTRTGEKKKHMCNNILNDGWDYCMKQQKEPNKCNGYCKQGEYKPSKEWTAFRKIITDLENEFLS